MPNRKQRQQNASNYDRLMYSLPPKNRCPNCKELTHHGHFAPPSLGESGFYTCSAKPT